MPTSEQNRYRGIQQLNGARPQGTNSVWRWQGFVGGGQGRITNGYTEVIAPIQGNAMPAINQIVQYQSGDPGVITLPTTNVSQQTSPTTARPIIEDIDIVIDTGNGTYPLITSSSTAYTVRAITSSGTGTGTLSPTIDADIAIGGSLDLTLSGNDDTRWSATIRLQRKA